jgi:hypothetical protein
LREEGRVAEASTQCFSSVEKVARGFEHLSHRFLRRIVERSSVKIIPMWK